MGVGACYICVCFSVGLGIYSMHASFFFFCGCRYMFYTCFTLLWCRYMFHVFAFACMQIHIPRVPCFCVSVGTCFHSFRHLDSCLAVLHRVITESAVGLSVEGRRLGTVVLV